MTADNPSATSPNPAGSPRPGVDVASREPEQNGRIPCPVCGFPIGAVRGSKAAICGNCGFKDGCC
jgi:hypothetical protein